MSPWSVGFSLCLSSAFTWVQPLLQRKVDYRAGDTVLAVPAKIGTTWMMNTFHQFRTGGYESFVDVYAEVLWLDFKEHPGQSDEELLE
jgi:aryl sulfotransferase